MKCTILLTLSLWASTAALLFSQAPGSASCKYKHLTFYAEKGESLTPGGMAHTVYLVKDSLRQSVDTLGKIGPFFDRELCACTDTSVAFYQSAVMTPPAVNLFYLHDQKWNFNRNFLLPESELAYVGILTKGKQYKKYKHRLITPEKVVSDLKIYEGKESGGLNLIGSYAVEFTLSPDKKNYVLSKETLNKE